MRCVAHNMQQANSQPQVVADAITAYFAANPYNERDAVATAAYFISKARRLCANGINDPQSFSFSALANLADSTVKQPSAGSPIGDYNIANNIVHTIQAAITSSSSSSTTTTTTNINAAWVLNWLTGQYSVDTFVPGIDVAPPTTSQQPPIQNLGLSDNQTSCPVVIVNMLSSTPVTYEISYPSSPSSSSSNQIQAVSSVQDTVDFTLDSYIQYTFTCPSLFDGPWVFATTIANFQALALPGDISTATFVTWPVVANISQQQATPLTQTFSSDYIIALMNPSHMNNIAIFVPVLSSIVNYDLSTPACTLVQAFPTPTNTPTFVDSTLATLVSQSSFSVYNTTGLSSSVTTTDGNADVTTGPISESPSFSTVYTLDRSNGVTAFNLTLNGYPTEIIQLPLDWTFIGYCTAFTSTTTVWVPTSDADALNCVPWNDPQMMRID